MESQQVIPVSENMKVPLLLLLQPQKNYLMFSKQQFCCNRSALFVLAFPWRPGRPTCHLDYLNRTEGLMADRAGSLQAAETVGSGLVPVAAAWAQDNSDVLTGWVRGNATRGRERMDTWRFVFTGQGLAFFSPLILSFSAETSPGRV